MASGGARNRSGQQPDPASGRSDRRGYTLTALPSEGFKGTVPEFPLPPAVVVMEIWDSESKQKDRILDSGASEERREREQELWEWAWSTPQACAWSMAKWRHHSVAMWVRTSAICESSDATAADKNALHRFADQIGLTPAGLKENGWAIAIDELAAKAAEHEAGEQPDAPREKPVRRLRKVSGDGGN